MEEDDESEYSSGSVGKIIQTAQHQEDAENEYSGESVGKIIQTAQHFAFQILFIEKNVKNSLQKEKMEDTNVETGEDEEDYGKQAMCFNSLKKML